MAQCDYGKAGLIGMMTPQANTTVEPELWALMPPNWSMINARLTSDKATIADRLRDYTTKYLAVSEQFANAPITALGAGCTGASYLIGKAREEALIAEIADRRGAPCVTAASATVAALRALGAEKIGLVSPYPEALDAPCDRYWRSFGFDMVAKTGPALETGAFHPIYAIDGDATEAALRRLRGTGCDAIAMLGTGMATLSALAAIRRWDGPPAISCNLALIWALIEAGAGRAPDRESLLRWIDGDGWIQRRQMMFPTVSAEHA